MQILRTAAIRELDRRAIKDQGTSSLDLMERAGRGCAEVILQRIFRIQRRDIHVFCGKGNNGGDGLVVARYLAEEQCRVRVYLTHTKKDCTPETQANWEKLPASVKVVEMAGSQSLPSFAELLAEDDVVIDALLGVGIKGDLKEPFKSLIAGLRDFEGEIIAIDVPSGSGEDNGAVTDPAMRATRTLTIGMPKVGLYLEPATYSTGEIEIIPLEYPAEALTDFPEELALLEPVSMAPLMVPRTPAGHKGTYGKLLFVGGSRGMPGSIALAAGAAMRAGAGMVTVATAVSAQPIVAGFQREIMTVALPETPTGTISPAGFRDLLPWLEWATTLVVGPGLTTDPAARAVVRTLLDHWDGPLLLDADGLKIAGQHLERLGGRGVPAICTPHLGEASALLGIPIEQIRHRRLDVALEAAKTHELVMVLKGYRTVIAAPDGHASISTVGNPGLGTAGTGDVLTGIIGGLLAQGLAPYDAARAGVYLHGEAADHATEEKGEIGLIAGDLIEALPSGIRFLTALQQGEANFGL